MPTTDELKAGLIASLISDFILFPKKNLNSKYKALFVSKSTNNQLVSRVNSRKFLKN